MIRSFVGLVRFVVIFALTVMVIQIVVAKQNHKPVHSPLIVRQIGSRIP